MDVDSIYDGESVRRTIRRLYGGHSGAPVRLPHVTVTPITASLVSKHATVFETVLKKVREQLRSEQQSTTATAATSPLVAGHWLLSVPPSMRKSEEGVVNYLGMLVAIDFCHWAEVQPRTATAEMKGKKEVSSQALEPTEEGGIVTAPGKEVTGFAGFYAVEEELPTSTFTSSSNPGQSQSSSGSQTAHTKELLTESVDKSEGSQESEAEAPASGAPGTKKVVTLLRGSAAMTLLLRRAVEVHNVPWYDVHYLQQFNSDVDIALGALKVCFMGCEKDGITPMWMPCTRRRVQLLLSLADAFVQQRTSFYHLLQESKGYMFRPPADTDAARAGVRGFVPSLVRFHPRYHDFARECGDSEVQGAPCVPILKLSQLTALAVEQALPPLWRCNSSAVSSVLNTITVSSSSGSWLSKRAAQVISAHDTRLFIDHTELSICCDYQIPKTLRAAGMLVYDEELAHMVDHHVLLLTGSAEEASIRIATLVAADRLQEYLNAQKGHVLLPPEEVLNSDTSRIQCDAHHLDYALWYVGRYMVPSEARHHLCRTIMY